MKAERIGRALGIGFRVAGRIAGQRIAGSVAGQPQTAQPRQVGSATVSGNRGAVQAAGRATVRAGQGVKQGVGGFLRPFRRVGGIVWLEVTGVFFLLFALVFGWYMWQSWAAHANPGGYRNVALSGVFMVLFLYLGLSSFWRASKR
jgi:hypothetical protein